MAISAVIACSSQGANILHWLDDMVRMPTYVHEVVTRTSDAIKAFDETNRIRFEQVKDLIREGDSNTMSKVECLHFQFQMMRNSNDADHAQIRAGQALLKANQQAVMHTLDSMCTNQLIQWPQQYGRLLKETKPN